MNRPKPGGVPYGQLIKTCKDPGMGAPTFDDGPFQCTRRFLGTLKGNGNQGLKNALKRIMADGHQIGSHSFSHKPLSSLSQKDKVSEMVKLENALHGTTGKKPTYMRPPNFDCNDKCMKLMGKMGYHVIDEDLDTHDWKNMSNMQVSKGIVKKGVGGADSMKTTSFHHRWRVPW
ncbi:glycoside hydrolase/deacetylase [Tuber magnatum]|uniref:Glycoside hydrolase/deacetylase n=1 Tax=Tuber magnatum TaxID=42249 RepID=A0A317SEH7_9PEZI|nr:glycoside hydrolase/deacetylase [Tuber magnatum]